MANPEFGVRHITSRSALPNPLEQGKAYFVDDEGSIVINHGSGEVTYGAKKTADTNTAAIGTLSTLKTSAKNNLVSAVNEVQNLTSTVKTTADAADTLSKANSVYIKPLRDINTFLSRNYQYRGANIGTHPTAAQLSELKNGTCNDIYLGDYWEDTMTYESYDGTEITRKLRWRIVDFFYNPNFRYTQVKVWLANTYLYAIPRWDEDSRGKGMMGSYLFQHGMTAADNLCKAFFEVNGSCLMTINAGLSTAAIPGEEYYMATGTPRIANIPTAHDIRLGGHPLILSRRHTPEAMYTRANNFADAYDTPQQYWHYFQFRNPILEDNTYNHDSTRHGFWLANDTANGKYAPYYAGWGILGFSETGGKTNTHTIGNTEIGFAPYVSICNSGNGSRNY